MFLNRIVLRDLIRSLNKLCKYLQSEYEINYGGCCFVASEIAKHLDSLGIQYELVVESYEGKDLEAINSEVRSKHKNKGSSHSVVSINTCSHYYLHVKGIGSINKGSRKYSENYIITGITSENIQWVYTKGSWNSTYNKQYNKVVRKFINLHFKRYEYERS